MFLVTLVYLAIGLGLGAVVSLRKSEHEKF